MTYPTRDDEPGALHHVMNRAIARRTLFEDEADMRGFLAQVAAAVHRGEIRVHAYCVLLTHFHLAVTSAQGRLSESMRRVQAEHVRRFNRRRGRDGPLVRGRFRSKRVRDEIYWRRLVRYIDQNAVDAGIVAHAELYPYGSARHYARTSGPRWLDRERIEREVRIATRSGRYEPASYGAVFGRPLSPDKRLHLERQLVQGDTRSTGSGTLLQACEPEVQRWLEWRCREADGTTPEPVLDVEAMSRSLECAPPDGFAGILDRETLFVGLLRAVCGLTVQEVAARAGSPRTTVQDRVRRHRQRMTDPAYAAMAARVTCDALRRYGADVPAGAPAVDRDSVVAAAGRIDGTD
jgi:REP element-mobilizing transposase RayT